MTNQPTKMSNAKVASLVVWLRTEEWKLLEKEQEARRELSAAIDRMIDEGERPEPGKAPSQYSLKAKLFETKREVLREVLDKIHRGDFDEDN